MSKGKKFCVYIHRRVSNGNVFYVGKGSIARAHSAIHRNAYWKRVSNKHGFSVHIVKSEMHEPCSLTLEKILIYKIGIKNLCNMTAGGEGISGFRHGKSKKDGMSGSKNPTYDHTLYDFVHPDHGEVRATRYEMCKKYGLNTCQLGTVVRGQRTHHRGWHLKGITPNHQKGEHHPFFIPTEYTFWHSQHGTRVSTRYHLAKEFDLHPANLMMMMRGKYQSTKGWRLIETPHNQKEPTS